MAMKLLLVVGFPLIFFLILFLMIRKKVAPKNQIQQRMQGLQALEMTLQREKERKLTPEQRERQKLRKLEDTPFAERVLIPAKEGIENFVLQFAPTSIQQYLQHWMIVAGKPAANSSIGVFIASIILLAVLFGGGMFFAMSGTEKPLVQRIALTVLSAFIGGFLPISSLQRKIKNRQGLIKKQLPEVLDLLCVSVQAGLSFDAALRKIVTRMDGEFIRECRKMLDDVRMGMTRRDALIGLGERCEVQEVSLFVTSIIQAERLGSNMSNTLKTQADNVRERHRQWVKAMALKAPVKIVLPLVGFILPAIFVVALGPALFNIVANFSK